MQNIQDKIHELQKIDPLSEAEKITGKDYILDDNTSFLGLLIQAEKAQQLDFLYDQIDDTKFSNTVPDYLRKLKKVGFEVIYTEDFVYTPDYGTTRTPQDEMLYVLWNKDHSILIVFDTFYGNVNSAHMYYNYSPNNLFSRGDCTASGHFYFPKENNKSKGHIGLLEADLQTPYFIPNYPKDLIMRDGKESFSDYRARQKPIEDTQEALLNKALNEGKRVVWSGYHDAREGVISTINRMLTYGKFLPKWIDCPYSWITHFAEHKGCGSYPFNEHFEATRKRMAKFPDEVQARLAQYRQD